MDADRARNTAFVPHSSPLAIASAEGAYLTTTDGRRILDAAGGAIVANIGYGREEVAEVAAEALKRLTYIIPPWASEERSRLVERLVANWLPKGMTRALFTSGGSESVESAVRLARQYQVAIGEESRWKVIGADLSYHGVSLGALSVGHHSGRRKGFDPLLVEHPSMRAPYSLEAALGRISPDPRESAADSLEEVILAEGPETVAAFICEPVTGAAAGVNVPPPNFWPRVREICSKYGVLLIADEVMSGFGRTGTKFGVDLWNVVPDIMTGGKGLAGGYAPMGAVLLSDEIYNGVADGVAPNVPVGHGHTYSAHPVSAAIGLEVLRLYEEGGLLANGVAVTPHFEKGLRSMLSHPLVGDARSRGLLGALELVSDKQSKRGFDPSLKLSERIAQTAYRNGLIFRAFADNILGFAPALCFTEKDFDLLFVRLRKTLDEVAAQPDVRAALGQVAAIA